ncbi:MAG TPA: cell wall hydrolase [Bradyrhizobium sp.]|nr:cell wall hydrolase [Bradyrhizobium sp.]
MDGLELAALCAFEEANLEPDDGVAGVLKVIQNRMRLRFQSDGTVEGTIFHGNGVAFSWAAFDWFNHRYQRVANGLTEIEARAAHLEQVAAGYPNAWARALRITRAMVARTYHGPDFDRLTDDTVLYLNPAIAHAPWATPDKQVWVIGHHVFYRA